MQAQASAKKPNKVEQVRALFKEGAVLECVENTYIPKHNGTLRRITKVGKGFAECSTGTGTASRMYFPKRVRDVIAVSETEATYLIDESVERLKGHTVTLRVVDKGGEERHG